MKKYEQVAVTVIFVQQEDIVTTSPNALLDGCITDGTWIEGGIEA